MTSNTLDYDLIDIDKDIDAKESSKSKESANSGVSMSTWLTQKLFLKLDKYSYSNKTSSLYETGKITPDEFVKAGDHLIDNYPSWQWAKGSAKKKKSFLPDEKQYLVTRRINCLPRDSNIINDSCDMDYYMELLVKNPKTEKQSTDDIDEMVEFDDMIDEDDLNVIHQTENCVASRKYDIYITYDTYYSTPRVWLYGYDENDRPLEGAEWQSDFSKEHVNKTVTYERHSHEHFSCPTIHPCKHAETMLNLYNPSINVKLYLIIFIKFIQTMIPNIECDFTSSVRLSE
jgi:ubiquitin-like-conjugating enzyme ATG3